MQARKMKLSCVCSRHKNNFVFAIRDFHSVNCLMGLKVAHSLIMKTFVFLLCLLILKSLALPSSWTEKQRPLVEMSLGSKWVIMEPMVVGGASEKQKGRQEDRAQEETLSFT